MEMRRLISNLFGIRNSIARKKWSVQAGFRLLLCALQSREQSDVETQNPVLGVRMYGLMQVSKVFAL
jgi:hypothetical protein